jgi:hypothetical protein
MKSKKQTHIELAAVGEIISPELNIIEAIENLVLEENITLLDAILHVAQTRQIEIEVVAGIIKKNGTFRRKFAEECRELHCLK